MAKQRAPADDLISRLARDQVGTGALRVEEAVGLLTILLVAGFETTAHSIALSVLALLQQRAQWDALVADPELVPGAVEELLRYLTVVHHGLVRAVRRDTTLGGVPIGAGAGVVVSLHSANHDPARFPDGAGLDVHRDAHDHLAFGSGVHQCVGQLLARFEMRVALRGLVGTVPGLRLATDPTAVRFRADAPIYGVHELPVTW